MHDQEGYAQEGYVGPRDSPKEPESASMRLGHAQDQMWKAIEAFEAKVPHLLGLPQEISEVMPDEPPATAFHNHARVAEMQTARLRDLTRRLEV
jgi:hypothetical protein